jgi:MFS transporter, PAT family, beta-lactamase induction signal transducer AmpG
MNIFVLHHLEYSPSLEDNGTEMNSNDPTTGPSRETAPLAPRTQSRSWRESLAWYLSPSSLRMVALGFSAGLPLLLVLGTLSFRLREAGIERTTIGFLSWVGLAYAFKWAWAPLVDQVRLPWLTAWLGRRRAWLLLSQLFIICGLIGMAYCEPQTHLDYLVMWAVWVAFGSATQDIALDAYRIESDSLHHQAALASMYQTGYRLGMIWAGAGALWIAARAESTALLGQYQNEAWCVSYLAMGASMAVGLLCVLWSKERQDVAPTSARTAQEWIQDVLVTPFAEFFARFGWHAWVILSLIGLYRISDIVMGIMANPFYIDMGYTKDEIAMVTKVFGVLMTLLGAFLGGLLSSRWGNMKVLMWGAILSAASNLLFAWLAGLGHAFWALVWVISVDNLSGGIASAAFIAYLSGLTKVQYSATQYALLSSIMLLAPKWLAGFSGLFVDQFGYQLFFCSTALIGLPVLLLIFWVHRIEPA